MTNWMTWTRLKIGRCQQRSRFCAIILYVGIKGNVKRSASIPIQSIGTFLNSSSIWASETIPAQRCEKQVCNWIWKTNGLLTLTQKYTVKSQKNLCSKTTWTTAWRSFVLPMTSRLSSTRNSRSSLATRIEKSRGRRWLEICKTNHSHYRADKSPLMSQITPALGVLAVGSAWIRLQQKACCTTSL